jgi:hypothetical protein
MGERAQKSSLKSDDNARCQPSNAWRRRIGAGAACRRTGCIGIRARLTPRPPTHVQLTARARVSGHMADSKSAGDITSRSAQIDFAKSAVRYQHIIALQVSQGTSHRHLSTAAAEGICKQRRTSARMLILGISLDFWKVTGHTARLTSYQPRFAGSNPVRESM